MSIWQRIRQAIGALRAGEPLSALFERMTREPEKTVAFTIAVIALGAKMAKADGRVTRDEIAAFKRIFHIAPKDEAAAARVYNTARMDVAGFDFYARRIARMFHDRPAVLVDIIEGLVFIAMADGEFHPGEEAFLDEVAAIFGVPEHCMASLKARHMPEGANPYLILGVTPDIDDAALRTAYRKQVRELHPDRMLAHGLPQEALRLAEQRLARINAAYEEVRKLRTAVG